MEYQQILNNLQHSINNKGENDLFFKSLQDFKKMDIGISTKFLKNLCVKNDNRKKILRICYLLRKCELKTKKENRYFSKLTGNNYKTTITEYTTDEKYKIRTDEKAFIKNSRVEKIGREFIKNFTEVLNFVVI